MGTSQSSSGAPSGVPMVPPWTPDPNAPEETPSPESNQPDTDSSSTAIPDNAQETPPVVPSPVAPAGRFRGARISLGKFGESGRRQDLQRGVGRYVRRGLGGSATASSRLGGTTRTAGILYNTLSGAATDRASEVARRADALLAEGGDARRLIDVIIEVVRPVDGTQDGEASRQSIHDAMSDVLTRYPDADLLRLSADQRDFVIERFVAGDVFRRFMLDVGGAIRDRAPSATSALSRLKEARDYIRETVVGAFQKLREGGQRLTSGAISRVVHSALQEAFVVFEEYAR